MRTKKTKDYRKRRI